MCAQKTKEKDRKDGSSKIALQILQYLVDHKRVTKGLTSYEDTFAQVVRHLEKYVVLKIQGKLTKAEDKDAFMGFLHNIQQNGTAHGTISFEEDHLISASTRKVPEEPERFKVSWDGTFQSVDLTKNNKVGLLYDSNGEQLLDDWEDLIQFYI